MSDSSVGQWMLHSPTEGTRKDRIHAGDTEVGLLARLLCSAVLSSSSHGVLTAPFPPERAKRPLPRVPAAAGLWSTRGVFFLLLVLVPEASGSRRSNCVQGLRSDK